LPTCKGYKSNHAQWGKTNLPFFKKKIKNTDPLMGAKHLLYMFFDFWHRFLGFWLQSLKKVQI